MYYLCNIYVIYYVRNLNERYEFHHVVDVQKKMYFPLD